MEKPIGRESWWARVSLLSGVLLLGVLMVRAVLEWPSAAWGRVALLLAALAIVAGHVASARIRKSPARWTGKGIALAGLILGYVPVIAILVVGFAGKLSLHDDVRDFRSKEHLDRLARAIENYYSEYSNVPKVGSRDFRTDDDAGRRLLTALLSKNGRPFPLLNPRGISFLSTRESREGHPGGLEFDQREGDSVVGLYDHWGNPYRVIFGSLEDDVVRFKSGGQSIEVRRKWFVVTSKGPDGVEGTADDLKSW